MPHRLLPAALVAAVFVLSHRADGADDWTKLFNGRDLAGWETYLDKPRGQPEPIGVGKDPGRVFTVTGDGLLRVSGETLGVISTTQEYENYHLRLQFKWGERRWPPREANKRDSGILYHAHGPYAGFNVWTRSHECQIQETDCGDYWSLGGIGSFALGADGTTFDPAGDVRDPAGTRIFRSANHENPHGAWNTIEVICAGDTATHLVNGRVVNRLSNSRRRDGDASAPLTRGRIQLQSEYAEVFYRDVELRRLSDGEVAAAAPTSRPAVVPNGPPELPAMRRLFNGKDLAGWDGDARLWRVEDGILVGQTTPDVTSKTNTFLIHRGGDARGEAKDFELRLSYRITGGNSGVQYRSAVIPNPTDAANTWRLAGYQAEIADLAGKDAFLYHEQGEKTRGYPEKSRYLCYVGDRVVIDGNGTSASVGKLADNAALAATYRKGGWNDYVIIARGNVLKHFLNGYQTVEAVDNDVKNALRAGLIALQLHQGPPMKIEFRDIRIKHFDAAAP